MKRHDIDLVSLAAGLLFLVVSVVHIASRAADTDLNLRWMAPAVLVVLGVIGLLGVMRIGAQPKTEETDSPDRRSEAADADAEASEVPTER